MRAPFQILAIPYRLKPHLQYCVLHRSDIDQYQFVAGGGEDDEKPIEAAVREIYEETSVNAVNILPLTSMAYIPADVISKKHRDLWDPDTIVIPEYTFGFECNSEMVLSSEHIGLEWMTYDDALTRLTWDSNKTALYELNCRLLKGWQLQICGGEQNMLYDIVPLPKDRWKGVVIPLTTRSNSYYDLEISPLNNEGCTVSIVRKTAEKDIVHTPEEYDYPDSLYQDHWEGAEAYGVLSDAGEMMACIEVCPEEWSNRLMVTELWVSEELRGKGIGKKLMDKAKEVALQQKRRVIILETQSCNTNAIGFYLHQGFELIGFDTCCYTNNDIGRREVRINLGYYFHREGRRR